ncbi:hypothetical protein L6Q79_07630 [bacterium]|nr:hypothetical protein [bacterium]NUN44566.1 hypothetical protein [bacterium]
MGDTKLRQLDFHLYHLPRLNRTEAQDTLVPNDAVESVQAIFLSVYRTYKSQSRRWISVTRIEVSFYNYTQFKHTMQIRDHTARVRISAIARTEPAQFFEALAHVLWSKIFGVRCPDTILQYYKDAEWRLSREKETGTKPTVKRFAPPKGRVYDLAQIKDQLDAVYFDRNMAQVQIGWSLQKARTRLGHYDRSAQMIIMSPVLDHPDVPPAVVTAIVYHEMLHHKHPVVYDEGRQIIHSRAFQQEEKRFVHYAEAQHWLKTEYPQFLTRRRGPRWFKSWFT